MQVQTDHQIVSFGADLMTLFDNVSGNGLVIAQRPDSNSPWTIHADGTADVQVSNGDTPQPRNPVLQAMVDHALAVSPGTGYSTLVPLGLAETP